MRKNAVRHTLYRVSPVSEMVVDGKTNMASTPWCITTELGLNTSWSIMRRVRNKTKTCCEPNVVCIRSVKFLPNENKMCYMSSEIT